MCLISFKKTEEKNVIILNEKEHWQLYRGNIKPILSSLWMIFGKVFDSDIHNPMHNAKWVRYMKYNSYVEAVKLQLIL